MVFTPIIVITGAITHHLVSPLDTIRFGTILLDTGITHSTPHIAIIMVLVSDTTVYGIMDSVIIQITHGIIITITAIVRTTLGKSEVGLAAAE